MSQGLEQLQDSPGGATDWGQSLFEEMQEALPGASAEFIFKQLERNSTLADATWAWMIELNRRIADAQAEIERLRSRRAE